MLAYGAYGKDYDEPKLFVPHWNKLLVSNEVAYEHGASSDKDIVYIEGATHVTLPIKPQYGDTKKTTFDYIDGWLDPRF